ncbi:MAG: MFS transporter [Desulfobacterales bacterium]|nr:MAG: MFS transporter [Desulfobacterales bacterium]
MKEDLQITVRQPMYHYLMLLTICAALGLQSWRTLFDNFAVHKVGLDGAHVGMIQSVREIPGFLTFLTVFVLLFMKEHRLSALSVLFLGVGVVMTGLFPTYGGLVVTTLIMSLGYHYYETTNQSLTLQYFSKDAAPRVFGKLRSLSAATNMGVGAVIYFMAARLGFAQMYAVIGGVIILCALRAFFMRPARDDMVPQHKKMIFRRRYGLFYFLTFMAGARRQIFIAFAVFLVVQRFHYSVREVTILFVINNLVNFFLSPWIGKAIIRFGERKVLSLEYASLILIFTAYGLTESRLLVGILYVLDHVFFNFAIAIRTYFQKVGDPRDIAPSMAVGFAINHIAAVVLPALGGFLWMLDYRMVFFAGAVMSLISLIAAQWIRTPESGL